MTQHARDRATQRHNIDLSFDEERKVIHKLRRGECIHIKGDAYSENMYFAYVIHNNIPLKVLYKESESKGKINKIITVYPFDTDEYNNAKAKQFKDKIQLAIDFLKANGYKVSKEGE